jgi:hypothetical protein
MFSPKNSLWFWLFLCAAQFVFGQGGPDCRQPTVIASLIDHQGVVPTDLTSDNFRVTFEGRLTKPLSAIFTKAPRRVVVLLDVSGSMSGKWQVARAAAWDLVAALLPGSRASLMTFSEKAEIETALSPDLKAIQDWLTHEAARGFESFHGRTALYAAVQAAVALLEPIEPGDAIYVITDGGENASRMSESKVEDALRSKGVRLFGLIIPSRFFAQEGVGRLEFADLSKQSGGFVETLSLSDSEFREPAVYDERMQDQVWLRSRRLGLEIEAFYSLTLKLPDNPVKAKPLDINVVDGRGRSRKDLLRAYPHKLSACRVESVQR